MPTGGTASPSSTSSDDDGSDGADAHGLLGYVRSLLWRGSEEIVPWLSWKVFDILFALLLLRLAKRFKCIRRLQELEVL